MSRRGINIYKRKDGRWEGRIPLEKDVFSGKRRYKYLYAYSYGEIKLKMKEAVKNDFAAQDPIDGTYGEWLQKFMQEYYRPGVNIKESTYADYIHKAETHILPKIGKILMNELNTEVLQAFFTDLSRYGRKDGKGGLSPQTIHVIYCIVNLSLKRHPKIRGNPCQGVIQQPKQTKRMRVLTLREQRMLEDILIFGDDLRCVGVLFCLYTGMRVGEMCALTWGDIDLEERTFSITKTLKRIMKTEGGKTLPGTKIIIDKPKSVTSVRAVPFPDIVYRCLCAMVKNLPEWRRQPDQFVICSDNGMPYEPRTFERYFQTLLKRAGLKDASFHCLRHTFATRAIELNISAETLMSLLGHTDIGTTMRYVHALQEHKVKEVQKFDQIDRFTKSSERCLKRA